MACGPDPAKQAVQLRACEAYYVVSEALPNAAEHAHASTIDLDANITTDDNTAREVLVLSVRDDGVGGADPALGSGLAGLVDRVEALGGHLKVSSPAAAGPTPLATLPRLLALGLSRRLATACWSAVLLPPALPRHDERIGHAAAAADEPAGARMPSVLGPILRWLYPVASTVADKADDAS